MQKVFVLFSNSEISASTPVQWEFVYSDGSIEISHWTLKQWHRLHVNGIIQKNEDPVFGNRCCCWCYLKAFSIQWAPQTKFLSPQLYWLRSRNLKNGPKSWRNCSTFCKIDSIACFPRCRCSIHVCILNTKLCINCNKIEGYNIVTLVP